jgi:hypothetical protein
MGFGVVDVVVDDGDVDDEVDLNERTCLLGWFELMCDDDVVMMMMVLSVCLHVFTLNKYSYRIHECNL